MSGTPSERRRARVYQSLQRTPMMLGLPQDVVFLGGFAILLIVVTARMSLVVVGLCVAIALIALPFLRLLFAREPDFLAILPRALRYAPFYPRQARARHTPHQDRVGN